MITMYRRYERSSAEQLRLDFGTYPPAPLVCEAVNTTFVVAQVRGPGRWINFWRRSDELLGAFEQDRLSVAVELRPVLLSLSQDTDFHARADHTQDRAHSYTAPRIAVRLMILMALRTFERSSRRGQAYFSSLFAADRQLTVLGMQGARDERLAALLTHEHLHFLQHAHQVKPGKDRLRLASLLAPEKRDDPYLLYLLEPLEVEARLHELVLSYYRDRNALPVSIEAFMGLLTDWEDIGEYLVAITAETALQLAGSGKIFRPRSPALGADLGAVLGYLKDGETTRRYITEVLTVMYGRLLLYYGDAPASQAFLGKIQRPNLYDEVYASSHATDLSRQPDPPAAMDIADASVA